MAKAMRQLTPEERREFLAARGTKSVGPHNMSKRVFHWSYCSRCGLIALKNAACRQALKRPCVVYE